jgi:hypothetical protein
MSKAGEGQASKSMTLEGREAYFSQSLILEKKEKDRIIGIKLKDGLIQAKSHHRMHF